MPLDQTTPFTAPSNYLPETLFSDLIFDETSTTSELYDKVARPIVSKALAGVNGTIFAYGQTSSGELHDNILVTRLQSIQTSPFIFFQARPIP